MHRLLKPNRKMMRKNYEKLAISVKNCPRLNTIEPRSEYETAEAPQVKLKKSIIAHSLEF